MKIFGALLVTIIAGTMFLSLFQMSMTMSMTMDMTTGMANCPFMSHGEVICKMGIADHLGAWKALFLSTVPTVLFLLAGALLVSAIATAPYLVASKIKRLIVCCLQPPIPTYTYCYRALQELFSNGILHPKLF